MKKWPLDKRKVSPWLCQGLTVAFLAGFAAAGQAQYLRVIGPAPIRFQSVPKPLRSGEAWSRLAPENASDSTPETGSSTTANASPTEATIPHLKPEEPVVTTARSPSPVELHEFSNEPMPWVNPEQQVIGPQVFLPYLQRSVGTTNAGPDRAGSPLFIPPTRIQRSPSKAAYFTP